MPSRYISSLGRTLDARPDRLDLRDREFVPLVRSLPAQFPDDAHIADLLPRYVDAGLILDQGQEGACTGFGLACVVNYLFFRQTLEKEEDRNSEPVSPRMLYHLARFYDEWPGEDYEGSSCRGALKAWHKHGVCAESLWPYRRPQGEVEFIEPAKGWDTDAMRRRVGVYYRVNRASVVDLQAAILQIGAVYASADVHDGWGLGASRKELTGHDALPRIRPISKENSLGGHAFALVGYNMTGFVVQNSWGRRWGNIGFAVLPYEDWVEYGTDAWACALGLGADGARSPAVVRGSAPQRRESVSLAALLAPRPAPAPPQVKKAVKPWGESDAYESTIVMGNDGRVISRVVTHANGNEGVRRIVAHTPTERLRRSRKPRPVMLYAHGGLNSEDVSLSRIRVLAPYFAANGILPLFITWRTGAIETLGSILEDELARVPRPDAGVTDFFDRLRRAAGEVLDRTIEAVAGPVAKPIWSQMKQNAEASAKPGRGCALIADALAELNTEVADLEIHFVGHSAGSILLGHVLDLMRARDLRLRTCSLYAPACTVRFALDHYRAAVDADTLAKQDLHIHLLSDEREREDTVGPYRKSLLYLVSRALETSHKTPILGLAETFNPADSALAQWADEERESVTEWQSFWGRTNPNLHVLDATQVSTGSVGRFMPAAHGCFDNDADTIRHTLRRILRSEFRHEIECIDF
jgi:hypothetical protein